MKKSSTLTSLLIIVLLQILFTLGNCKEVFIEYGLANQGSELFKYFHDLDNSNYVDIGAFDPIYLSNTLNLATRGWTGLNFDASALKVRNFFTMRPLDNTIQTAVGQEHSTVTFYEMFDGPQSTISKNVKVAIQYKVKVAEEYQIFSISMKQICHNFYNKKPTFLTIDIEGYGGRALELNDWKTEKCRPEIICSQMNKYSQYAKVIYPVDVLTNNGYIKLPEKVGLNEIFIEKSKYDHYMEKYKQGDEIMKKKISVKLVDFAAQIQKAVRATATKLKPHYNVVTDGIFYYFSIKKEILNIEELQRKNHDFAANKSRPIVVLHYDPLYSTIAVPNKEYTLQKFNFGKNPYSFYNLTIKDRSGKTESIYIFNHQYEHSISPVILVKEKQPCETPVISKEVEKSLSSKYSQELQRYFGNFEARLSEMEKNMDEKHNTLKSNILDSREKVVQGLQELFKLEKSINSNQDTVKQMNRNVLLGHENIKKSISQSSENVIQQKDSSNQQSKKLDIYFSILAILLLVLIISLTWKRNSKWNKNASYQQTNSQGDINESSS